MTKSNKKEIDQWKHYRDGIVELCEKNKKEFDGLSSKKSLDSEEKNKMSKLETIIEKLITKKTIVEKILKRSK